MVVRKDHLRDCQGVWQSQVIVPKDLAGSSAALFYSHHEGPQHRTIQPDKAADTPRHIEFVADALLRIKAAKEAGRVVEPPCGAAMSSYRVPPTRFYRRACS